jgi:hypothetical protein
LEYFLEDETRRGLKFLFLEDKEFGFKYDLIDIFSFAAIILTANEFEKKEEVWKIADRITGIDNIYLKTDLGKGAHELQIRMAEIIVKKRPFYYQPNLTEPNLTSFIQNEISIRMIQSLENRINERRENL